MLPEAEALLQAQLAEMARTVGQLQLAVLALAELVQRPPVHLTVDHMAVERLEFRIDQIDVDQLTGEMNVGLTAMMKGGGGAAPVDGAPSGPPAGSAPGWNQAENIHPIWPPVSGKGGEHQGEQTDPTAGTDAEGAAGRPGG